MLVFLFLFFTKLFHMIFFRICLIVTLGLTTFSSFAQENNPNIYTDSNGQIYVKVDSPIYFFIASTNEPNNKVLIPSTDSLANPMYFDGPGRHYFVYNNKGEKIRYLVLADAKGPKPKVKVEKGLLFGRDKRIYVDLNSELSLDAKDDYSGFKTLHYSINGSEFNTYSEFISFEKEGESELKVYATDNVGNIGDTSIYRIIVSPEAIFKIDNIYYETASARILSNSYSHLEEMIQIMKEFPELNIEIRAHADARGSSESNKVLSERRAQSVANYLISKGINSRRMKIRGFGDSQIINDCIKGVPCPDSKHMQNRRVEFKFSLPK